MREILFRGKREEDGEWIEGYLVKHFDKCYIYYEEPDEMCQVGSWFCGAEVIPETVEQYTGLTDKNGNKIWENDVVYIPYERLEDSYCKVIFRRGEFIGEMADGFEDCLLNRKTEVIGNIFDNPELLKGE